MTALYGLRLVMTLAIIFHHLNYPNSLALLAVSFFFVISGFLTGWKIISSKSNGLEYIADWKNFFIKKISKLYPLYVVSFFAMACISRYLTHIEYTLTDCIVHLLLLQTLLPSGSKIFLFNGLAWFVSDLLLFYLCTPILWKISCYKRLNEKPRDIVIVMTILYTVSFGIGMFFNYCESYSFGWWLTYISPYHRIFDYALGMFSGFLYFKIEDFLKNGFYLNSIFEIAIVLLAYVWWRRPLVNVSGVIYSSYWIPICVLLIMIFAANQGILSYLLGSKPFVELGKRSFPAYMIHTIVIIISAYLFNFSAYYNSNLNNVENIKNAVLLITIILVISWFIDWINIILSRVFIVIIKNYILD